MKIGIVALSVAVLLSILPAPSHGEGGIGFLEKFALSPDRQSVLAELIPSSEDYYFFHALHYQNTRQKAKLNEILEQWKKRRANSPQRTLIENREALLSYDASPQETLAFLRKRLNLQFNHEQKVRDQKPDLPSALDQARISRDVFQSEALRSGNGLDKITASGLEALVREKAPLTPSQTRKLLSRLERPDVPDLLDLIAADLRTKESRGFGEFQIHRALLPDQLDDLLKRVPTLVDNQAFIDTRLRKLAPGADADPNFDSAEREAWLDRVWAYVSQLSPAYNSLKVNVLHQRLRHDRSRGIYDEARFLAYIQLPRRATYMNPKFFDAPEQARYNADLGVDFSEVMPEALPIGNDERLVRDYFLHFFSKLNSRLGDLDPAEILKRWTPLIRDAWLKPVFAEAMITNGIGEPERWASLLSPAAFQALKDRVDVEFSPANREFHAPADDVSLDLFLKNTPKLIVKIYEINALSYFLENQRQLNTDLPLDGLVANREITHDFSAENEGANPFRRLARTFKFPELKGKRGAWIIEFIGGGKSSRALIRKGQWSVIQHTGPAGDMITVLDETRQPVKDAALWIDGHRLTVDEKSGSIIVPFAPIGQTPTENAVITDPAGDFASLVKIARSPEAYVLIANFFIPREQLLAGKQATVAMRAGLLLNVARMPLALLENPRILITSITLDGVVTAAEVKIDKFDPAKDFTHTFSVPERLKTLEIELTAEVSPTSNEGRKQKLNKKAVWDINGIDIHEMTRDAFLSKIGEGYRVELLGKNGEPVANQSLEFEFHRGDFVDPAKLFLRTDEKGRVELGELKGIKKVVCVGHHAWPLPEAQRIAPGYGIPSTYIPAKAGESIVIPWSGQTLPDHVSLLETRRGTFVANLRAAITSFPKGAWNPGQEQDPKVRAIAPELSAFVISGLPPGDYSLALGGGKPPFEIEVTDGKMVKNWLVSPNRAFEIPDDTLLDIQSIVRDGEDVVIRIANADKLTRVHVAASRFLPEKSIFEALSDFERYPLGGFTPARLPNLFAAERQIGDEYRYILERRYSKIFPGNMLSRPGLILSPWEVRSTDLQGQQMAAMDKAASTPGGRDAVPGLPPMPVMQDPTLADRRGNSSGLISSNLNFLAKPAPALYNLIPDEHGAIRISGKAFGDRQYVEVYAEDLTNAVFRPFSLLEKPALLKDLRLARNLDPNKAFTEKKEQTVVAPGETLKLADILTSELETCDSLASVHALFTTLSKSPTLAKFAWILDWPKLKPGEKQAKYSEFACHELSFFLQRKDPDFFQKVILPYLQNKKDKTFMDDYLLGNDLHAYLASRSFERLNVAERCLLAQRIPAEGSATSRHLRELWDLLPPDPDRQNLLFETALRGRSLSASDLGTGDGALNELKKASAASADGTVKLDSSSITLSGGGTLILNGSNTYTGTTTLNAGTLAIHSPAPPPAAPKRKASSPADAQPNPAGEPVRADDEKEEIVDTLRQEEVRRHYNVGEIANKRVWSESQLSAEEATRQRAAVRQFFRALGPTKEWAENNYYQIPFAAQNADLITINAFWRDYAAWDGKSPFISEHLAEASRNFPEMMLALAVLDLPFSSPKHTSKVDGGQFTLTTGGPLVAFHKEIKPAAAPDENSELLVSENFYRNGDRYRMEGNEKFDKYVTGEFLSGVVYGATIVVTNPSSTAQKVGLLMQIPQGSLPVKGSKATDSKRLRLEAYTTVTFEYFFYFPSPRAEPFLHYPVSVSRDEQSIGAAKPSTFKVVQQLSELDMKSWDYISQSSSEDDVFAFLDRENIARLDLSRVAWRARKGADFFRKLIDVLAKRHTYNDVIYSYAVVHNDAPTLAEWLRHQDNFIGQCGPWLASKLLAIDPIERRAYEHLDYAPLVNQRAHRLGADYCIPNPVLRAQYLSLLNILAFKPALDAMDQMSVTYYLFLQDRTEEALARFHTIAPAALPARIQYDYFQCYAAFFEERLTDARGIANQYADYPVDRWRKLFAEVSSELDEIDGKAPPAAKSATPKEDAPAHSDSAISQRETQQGELASTEPSFDFKVENKQIALTWKNLGEVTIRYYLMDPEFLFSASPFVSEDSARVSIIKPAKSSTEKLPEGKDSLLIPLPGEFEKSNVLVEILGAGQHKSQAYHANTLKLALAENYGRLEVRDQIAGKPVSKAYVKVYARLKGGTVRFFKDGYTDLRGKFDYASLNSSETGGASQNLPASSSASDNATFQMLQPQELNSVEKLSILILSDTHGALVREVNPPAQ